MNSNWFKDLFLDEAKSALDANGGSGSSIEDLNIPTKFSDLENDLWGFDEREELFTVTKDDFTYDNEQGAYVAVVEHDVRWVNKNPNIGFYCHMVDANGEYEYTENDIPSQIDTIDYPGVGEVCMVIIGESLIVLGQNVFGDIETQTMIVASSGAFNENTLSATFTFYRKGIKKIPAEHVDVSQIKLSELTNDLWGGNGRETLFVATKDDFTFDENDRMWMAYTDNDISWLRSGLDINYCLSYSTPDGDVTITEADYPYQIVNLAALTGDSGYALMINGQGLIMAPGYVFSQPYKAVIITDASFISGAYYGSVEFTIYRNGEKKIPAEHVDVSQIKLSDLKNDLFGYQNRVEAFTLTSADFESDNEYKVATADYDMSWMRDVSEAGIGISTMGFEITERDYPITITLVEQNGNTLPLITVGHNMGYIRAIPHDDGNGNSVQKTWVAIHNDVYNEMTMNGDFEFTFYYSRVYKIPIEFIDTTQWETAVISDIDSLIEEVNNL